MKTLGMQLWKPRKRLLADIKLVQAVAGHANPLIALKRDSHLLDTRVTEAATRFDPAGIPLNA